MRNRNLALLILFNFWGCTAQAINTELSDRFSPWLFQCSNGEGVYFFSSFNESIDVVGDQNFTALSYKNDKRSCLPGWGHSVESNLKFGQSRIQFIGGSERERWAKIVPHNDTDNDSSLSFGISQAYKDLHNHERKARVQMELVGNKGLHNVYVKVRFKLDKDFLLLNKYPDKLSWMGISSWWNNGGWGENKYPFSFTVNITKPSFAENELRFAAIARTYDRHSKKFSTVWSEANQEFNIPVGEWMLLEYHVIEGGADSGIFKLIATDLKGKKTTIFNIKNYTHHPLDPAPDGFQDVQPVKLYTSKKVVDFFEWHNTDLVVYWDDLLIVGCKDKIVCSIPKVQFQSQ